MPYMHIWDTVCLPIVFHTIHVLYGACSVTLDICVRVCVRVDITRRHRTERAPLRVRTAHSGERARPA